MALVKILCFISRVAKKYSKDKWARCVRTLLKVELLRREITYEQLAMMLTKEGVPGATPHNVKNKINRGTYSAIFLIQVLKVIGCKSLDISDLKV